MDEIQIRKTLSKAKALKNIITEDLAEKVLEISDSAISAKNKDLLDRLIDGLEHYIAKDQDIIYIGFVGHFSSGKSTTINNILNLFGTSDERSADLNPTDTSITLITNKQNSKKLYRMSKESGLVPVRTTFIDSDFLKTLVIADTPGSGDPRIANEMIQDFLPICDYILYFVSATNPIDEADIPLLQQKHIRLPFIPLNFVITRTDEFSFDSERKLSDDNLDTSKKDAFVGQLIARLKVFTQAGEISDENFFFIDNKSKYQLDNLKNKIADWASRTDNKTLINNHSYKVDFYRRNLEEIESYFLTTIKEKILISSDFLKVAGENVKKFDDAVELNNEKMKIVWTDSERKLARSLQFETERHNEFIERQVIIDLTSHPDLQLLSKEVNSFILDQSNGNIGRFTGALYQHSRDKLIGLRQDVEAIIASYDANIEDTRTILPSRIDFSDIDIDLDIDFSKMNEIANKYINYSKAITNLEITKLLDKIEMVKSHIMHRREIGVVNEIYKNGEDIITNNFDKFFGVIEMYRAGVLTKNNMETIQKLRIGKPLDELDVEFSEDFRSSNKSEAVSAIYPSKDNRILQLIADINLLEDNLNEIKNTVLPFSRNLNSPELNFSKTNFKVSSILSDTLLAIESETNKLYGERASRSYELQRAEYLKFAEQKKDQSKFRKLAIFKWGTISGVVLLSFYVMMLKLDFVTPTSMFMTIIIGLGTTALGGALGSLVGGFRNDLKKISAKLTSEFQQKSRERLSAELNVDFFNTLTSSISSVRPKTLPSLELIFLDKFNHAVSPSTESFNMILESIRAQNNRVDQQVAKYLDLVSSFYDSFKEVFNDIDTNLDKIKQITQIVKEKSIQPSFALLKNTQTELERVGEEIASINTDTVPFRDEVLAIN